MEQIWSPWRMRYMQNNETGPECIFCEALKQEDGPENLVVMRGEHVFVILNRYPYTSGHLMVVPHVHRASLTDLDSATRLELMQWIAVAEQVLGQVYKPDGFNIGANLGAAAGAGVAGHLHFHVVPRWVGDTNFMTTLGEARVIPESLEDTYQRVKKVWADVQKLPEK